MEILILGGAGQVGLELQRRAWPADVRVSAPARDAVDLTSEAAIEAVIAQNNWGVVINAAAFTAVDQAEAAVADAWRLNALAPATLAAATARRRIPVVHLSTDYVFDGSADRPYLETDAVAPINVYGASKEAGEQAVRTANPCHAIIRTAWVVSAHRANFVKSMLRLARERDELRVVDDQHGCPTGAKDLAGAVAAVALRLASDPEAPTGTYHAVNAGAVTWCGFAKEIMHQAEVRGAWTVPVSPIGSADFPTPARRPANSRLATSKLQRDYGITLRPWQAGLSDILDELLGPAQKKEIHS